MDVFLSNMWTCDWKHTAALQTHRYKHTLQEKHLNSDRGANHHRDEGKDGKYKPLVSRNLSPHSTPSQ